MDVLFWGAERAGSVAALEYLIEAANVIGCIPDDLLGGSVIDLCRKNSIPIYTPELLIEEIEKGRINRPLWGLCCSYHSLIPTRLIEFPLNGTINFHPSPLPYHRGIAGSSYAKYNSENEWGVSAHYMDAAFDGGDIINVERFAIVTATSAIELDYIIQLEMYKLAKKTIDSLLTGKIPDRVKQNEADGHYYGRKDLNADKRVSFSDDSDSIKKKVEAFWFPPYEGAYIEINGERYTLVNKKILDEVSMLYDTHFQKEWDKQCKRLF